MKNETHILAFSLILLAILLFLITGIQIFIGILAFVVIVFAIYYFFHEDNKDKQDLLQHNVHTFLEEQEAHRWIEHTLAPKTNKKLQEKHASIARILGGILALVTFFWSLTITDIVLATFITIAVLILYGLIVFYIANVPKLFAKLPPELQPFLKNYWIRAYVVFLPIVLVLSLVSPYANIMDRGSMALNDVPKTWFIYTMLFTMVYAIMYLVKQYNQDEERKSEQEINAEMKKHH